MLRRKGATIALLAGASCCAAVGASGHASTYAAFSDFGEVTNNSLSAGIWAPDPPEACAEILSLSQATIQWGTPGDDTLVGGNHPQVLMGMGGNDTLVGGNQRDCLVGGAGDDTLLGNNAMDVLLGGPGSDTLDGGHSQDFVDGGEEDDQSDGGSGPDTCLGGGGIDTIANCEPSPPARSSSSDGSMVMLGEPEKDPADTAPTEVDSEESTSEPREHSEPTGLTATGDSGESEGSTLSAETPKASPSPDAATIDSDGAGTVEPPTEPLDQSGISQ